MSRCFSVQAVDGTSLRAWTNDGDGPPVLISNGMGSVPAAWPEIIDRRSGFRVLTWSYRGLSGSARPTDPGAIRVTDHAADLCAVMDAAGIDRALIVSWSIGVNVAFEFARQRPDRVAGILAVAGVPGDNLGSMYGAAGLPRSLREQTGALSAQLLTVTGPWFSFLVGGQPSLAGEPSGRSSAGTSALDPPPPDPAAPAGPLAAVLREFAHHDWQWYRRLVLAAGQHRPTDLSTVRCPVTLLGGRHDVIVSSRDMVAAARSIPEARVAVLAGSHLLPLQYPRLMLDELRLLAERADGAARTGSP